DVVELHHVADLDAVATEHAVRLPAGRDVALEADEGLAGELPDRQLLVLRELMARRADEDESVLAERDDRDLWAARRVRDDAEVDVPLERVLVDPVRAAVLEVQVHLRVRLQ